MIRTYGLTHIALAVRDVERSFRFYQEVFGMVAVYREVGFLQAQTPGSRDVLVFEEKPTQAGSSGGIAHFGFRLVRPEDIDAAVEPSSRRAAPSGAAANSVPGSPTCSSPIPTDTRSRSGTRSRPRSIPPEPRQHSIRLKNDCRTRGQRTFRTTGWPPSTR